MPAVMCETEKLTGARRLEKTVFGPRLFLEVRVTAWDTNTGYYDPPFTYWRKAKNSDIEFLSSKGTLVDMLV